MAEEDVEESRKQRRKRQRAEKKQRKAPVSKKDPEEEAIQPETAILPKSKKRERPISRPKPSKYSHLEMTTIESLRRDDEEIAALEAKLGLSDGKESKRLHKEYASEEGFGDDFGDFLDDLDDIINRSLEKRPNKSNQRGTTKLKVANDVAEAIRREDLEIEAVGKKLGLNSKKDQQRLHREYAEQEGYGDDFGDFLDGLDGMVSRVLNDENEEGSRREECDDSSEEDEVIPMREGVEKTELEEYDSDSSQSVSSNDEDSDHDVNDTYHPSSGEDIYGRPLDKGAKVEKPRKYVPPHLRKQEGATPLPSTTDSTKHQESTISIQRQLNSILNKLSTESVVQVAQAISKLYPIYASAELNAALWKNTKSACVNGSNLMVGLAPVYIVALAGVHSLLGDKAQLGEYLMESTIIDLWEQLGKCQGITDSNETEHGKIASNIMLCICYLYNFRVIHCTLLYDMIRFFIGSFQDIHIELLLLTLKHSGRFMRTDDPSALKEIVLLVQKKSIEQGANSSRASFMVTEVMNLKNNRRQNATHAAFYETAQSLRKRLGQLKSVAASESGGKGPSSLLNVHLDDILQAETKGRFWKVGASWSGHGGPKEESQPNHKTTPNTDDDSDEQSRRLDVLAKRFRMNSNMKRSIFKIIMSATDFEEAFENLTRGGLLKNRAERETVRVLIECCGQERTFNKYYAHLAARLCEFQPQCRFSIQLAFWDAFKTLSDDSRRANNLARLLFELVVVHRTLKLNTLKALDLSNPDEMTESALLFSTILLTCILEHFESSTEVVQLFEHCISRRKAVEVDEQIEQESDEKVDDGDALRASLTVFLDQVMKSSPNYVKGSRFYSNLKAALKACDTENLV